MVGVIPECRKPEHPVPDDAAQPIARHVALRVRRQQQRKRSRF